MRALNPFAVSKRLEVLTLHNLFEAHANFEVRSGFNAFDDDEWVLRLVDFVKKILSQTRVRIIGVCYGHQIVGRAMGAKVARSEGGAWEVSVCDVRLTAKGKALFHKELLVCRPLLSVDSRRVSRCRISNRQHPYRTSSRCTRISYTTIHQVWKS